MTFKFLIPIALAAFCLMGCSKTAFRAVESQDNKVLGDTEGTHISEFNSGGGLSVTNSNGGDFDSYSQASIGAVMAVNTEAGDISTVVTEDSQTQVKLGFMAIVSQLIFTN